MNLLMKFNMLLKKLDSINEMMMLYDSKTTY